MHVGLKWGSTLRYFNTVRYEFVLFNALSIYECSITISCYCWRGVRAWNVLCLIWAVLLFVVLVEKLRSGTCHWCFTGLSLISWTQTSEVTHLELLSFSLRRGFPSLTSPSLSTSLLIKSCHILSFEYRKGKRKIRFLNCVLWVVETATSVVSVCPRWPFGSEFLRFLRRVN